MNPSGSMTNFPQGFANGLSVRGMPLQQMQPGQVYFVGNSSILNPGQHAGSDSSRGTFLDPLATLNYAVNTACTPGRGDIVFILPNHAETISNATTLLLKGSGVAVIGLGAGSSRPTFTFDTATAANVLVSGANISIQNCLFRANFLSIASTFTGTSSTFTGVITADGQMTTSAATGTIYVGATVAGTSVAQNTVILSQLSGTTGAAGVYQTNATAAVASATMTTSPTDFAIDSCEFRDLSSVLSFLTIFTASATANACDGFQFTRNVVNGLGTVSPTVALLSTVSEDRWAVNDNFATSPVTAATEGPILLATGGGNLTNFQLLRNNTYRPNTSTSLPCAVSTSGTGWSGVGAYNSFGSLAASTGIWINTGSKLSLTQNFSRLTNTADKSNTLNPVAV